MSENINEIAGVEASFKVDELKCGIIQIFQQVKCIRIESLVIYEHKCSIF